MKNNTCEKCGDRVVRAKAGERTDKWISLDPDPIPERFARKSRRRRGVRVLDSRVAYLPDHMVERLAVRRTPAQAAARHRDDSLYELPWHREHKCRGGR